MAARAARTAGARGPRGRVADDLESELGRAPTSDEIARRIGVRAEQVLDAREASAAYRAVSLDRPRDDAEAGDDLVDVIGVEDPGYRLVDEPPRSSA